MSTQMNKYINTRVNARGKRGNKWGSWGPGAIRFQVGGVRSRWSRTECIAFSKIYGKQRVGFVFWVLVRFLPSKRHFPTQFPVKKKTNTCRPVLLMFLFLFLYLYPVFIVSPLTYPRCGGSTASAWPSPIRRPEPWPKARRTHWLPLQRPRRHRRR